MEVQPTPPSSMPTQRGLIGTKESVRKVAITNLLHKKQQQKLFPTVVLKKMNYEPPKSSGLPSSRLQEPSS